MSFRPFVCCALAGALSLTHAVSAQAALVEVRVTVENLAPANSVSFAPLRGGFHNGSFDAFNNGVAATDPIVSIAEGGSGSAWFPAFAAADPGAVLGSVFPNPAGPLVPGASGSARFTLDTALNAFFTFASMVVPSNDLFIGNDSPVRHRLFDDAGNLLIYSITQFGRDVWDAGSEALDPANAAFVAGGGEWPAHASEWRGGLRFVRVAGLQWPDDRRRLCVRPPVRGGYGDLQDLV